MRSFRSLRRQAGFVQFIPLIAAGVGAAASIFGGERSNEANAQMNADQMNFNREEAKVNREWQEHMSSTSYQRAVGDMRKAGLNPMLAYSQGGAPQGSGATATAGSLQRMENTGANAAASAASAMQLANIAAQTDNIKADTELKDAQAQQARSSAYKSATETGKIIEVDMPKIRQEIALLEKQNLTEAQNTLLREAEVNLRKFDAMLRDGEIDLTYAKAKVERVRELLMKLDIPERKAYSEKFQTDYGKDVSPYLKEIIDIVRALIYGARGVR